MERYLQNRPVQRLLKSQVSLWLLLERKVSGVLCQRYRFDDRCMRCFEDWQRMTLLHSIGGETLDYKIRVSRMIRVSKLKKTIVL